MRFAAVYAKFMRAAPAAVASPAAVGTWTRLYVYACEIEQSGRIPACARYDDRQWLALVASTAADVRVAVEAVVAASLGHEHVSTTTRSYAKGEAVAGAQQRRALTVLVGGAA